jgi:hypothetical protein
LGLHDRWDRRYQRVAARFCSCTTRGSAAARSSGRRGPLLLRANRGGPRTWGRRVRRGLLLAMLWTLALTLAVTTDATARWRAVDRAPPCGEAIEHRPNSLKASSSAGRCPGSGRPSSVAVATCPGDPWPLEVQPPGVAFLAPLGEHVFVERRDKPGQSKGCESPTPQGLATRGGPESCVGVREGVGEALAGVLAGWAIEPRKSMASGCRRRHERRKATSSAALSRVAGGPRAVKDPGHARRLCPREPGGPTVARGRCR